MIWVNTPALFDLSKEERARLVNFNQVLNSGELFRYREDGAQSMCKQLEDQFACHFGKDAAVAVVNGTAATRLALSALGVGPGDRVLVSAYSFIACAMTIVGIGAIPVPMDMSHLLHLDLASASRQIEGVSAVLAVHVRGHAFPMAGLRRVCDEVGVPLIEDACQAVGASSSDGRAGSVADVVVTSFQQSKQVSTGEGGLVSGPLSMVERAYRLADLGAVRRAGRPDWDDDSAVVGENLRLTELQAALALDQLQALPHTIERQRAVRRWLWGDLFDRVQPIRSQSPALDSGAHTLLLATTPKSARAFCSELASSGVLAAVVWPRTYMEFAVMKREPSVKAGVRIGGWPSLSSSLAPRIVGLTVSKYADARALERVADAVNRNADLLEDPRGQ